MNILLRFTSFARYQLTILLFQVSLSLRLTEPYHGTGRFVVGDSYFGSVTTALVLRSVGLYSSFIIKQAHKHSPKTRLLEEMKQQRLQRGSAIFELVIINHFDMEQIMIVGRVSES